MLKELGRQRAIPIFWRSSETVSRVRTPANVHTFPNPTINLPTQKPNIYLTYPFIYVILIVSYVIVLKKIQKTEQPTDTIDSQNPKCYTSLGNFFAQPEISEKCF